jgi:uncharacterized protein (TIGR01777 family)
MPVRRPMRVLLTGATGLIGRAVGKRLAARGDTLVCLVRDVAAARCRLPFPAALHGWDHTREVPAEALRGVDAVLNLAGEPVAEGRWSAAKKALILDSRVQGTRRLVEAVLAQGARVKVFVQGSASGYHGDRGDERLTADSAKGEGFLADVVEQWEAELQPLLEHRPEVRAPVVRTGIVLARDGGALAEMLPLFRLSAAGRLGSGRQWMSWIHLDDIVGLFIHALDAADTGLLEGVAPRPVTNAEFTTAFARALGVIENLPAPPPAIRLMFGEKAAIVLGSMRLEPAATMASGFRFRFERVQDALADLLAPLRDGTHLRVWEQWVPRTPQTLWPFFCDARNLEAITPPLLNFRVLGQSSREIGAGTLIDYRLRLDGIPLGWQSRIEDWDPPRRFVDTQVKGPYRLWHHTHDFEPMGAGTLMRDTVRYRLPAGWLGNVAAGSRVANYVGRIFDYRARKIEELFGGPEQR